MIIINSPPYFYGENIFFYTGAGVSCNTQVAHVRGVVDKGFGKKESTESKAYNTLMKNYISIIKVLLGELPQSKNEEDDEEFKKFLMDRVKR